MTRRKPTGQNWWGRLVGDLTPRQSTTVLTLASTSASLVATFTARRHGVPKGLAMGAVALDLAGGLVAFQLTPTRQRYATSPRAARLAFVALHAHPFLLPVLGLGTWRRATVRYAAALGSSVLLEQTLATSPHRRVIANTLAAALSVADLATDRADQHSDQHSDQRWFGPAYLMKLIGGHGGVPREADQPDVPMLAEVGAQVLGTRSLVRAPLWLYRHGLGGLLGSRVLMLEHTGRRSGLRREVCLEIVDRPAPDRIVLASGFGRTADWYRNLTAHPQCHVTLGRERMSATARLLNGTEADMRLAAYQRSNPRGWDFMQNAMTAATGQPVTTLPMVELTLDRIPRA